MDTSKLQKRFAELLDVGDRIPLQGRDSRFAEPQAFYNWSGSAINLLHGVFGETNPHYLRLRDELSRIGNNYIDERQLNACRGMFLGAKSDFDGGFLFDVKRSIAGELFGDMVALAKAALDEGHHTVAAVLASAALEDALKRFAESNDLVVEGASMEQVVNALKSKGLVEGPQKGLLSVMPKIRNHAMHADWDALTPQDAGSIIGFVEHFLLSNFG